ncbi:hypothetical protein ACFFSQ_48215 [Dactylosporangium matsuzakiense]
MAMNVEATVSGDRVRVTLRGPVDERDLERLGRSLWARRTRAFLGRAGLEREPRPAGWRAEEYVRRRAGIVACGQSGSVHIQVRGMRTWRVAITGRPTARDIEEAADALIRDQQVKIRALKRTIWQPPRDRPGQDRSQP